MLINLTPHVLNIADEAGNITTSLLSMGSARVESKSIPVDPIDGIPVNETVFGDVSGLPEAQEGTYYIVSQIVIAAAPDRNDLLRPDTGPTCLRDPDGRIIAVRSLTR